MVHYGNPLETYKIEILLNLLLNVNILLFYRKDNIYFPCCQQKNNGQSYFQGKRPQIIYYTKYLHKAKIFVNLLNRKGFGIRTSTE